MHWWLSPNAQQSVRYGALRRPGLLLGCLFPYPKELNEKPMCHLENKGIGATSSLTEISDLNCQPMKNLQTKHPGTLRPWDHSALLKRPLHEVLAIAFPAAPVPCGPWQIIIIIIIVNTGLVSDLQTINFLSILGRQQCSKWLKD